MKLKRKPKGVIFEINPFTGEVNAKEFYEEKLEESLFKKCIKDKWIWYWLVYTLIEIYNLYVTSEKFGVIAFTTFFWIGILVIAYRVRKLKNN